VGKDTSFSLDGHSFIKVARSGLPPAYVESLKINPIELSRFALTPNFDGEDDPRFVVGLSPIDAASALSFLFSGEKFPQLLKSMAIEIRKEKDEAKALEANIDAMQAEMDGLYNQITELDSMDPWIQFYPHIDEIVSYLEDLERDVTEISTLQREIHLALQSRDQAQERLSLVGTLDAELINEVRAMTSAVEEIEGLTQEIEDLQTDLEVNQSRLSLTQDVTDQKLAELKELNTIVVDMQACMLDIQTREKNKSLVAAEVKKVEVSIQEALADIDVCPVCSSPLNEETKDHLLKHMS
jgi:DNA repair exonuclease SbcCD ATPase subunit